MKERKPNGYWMKWENVEREIQVAIEKIGHFPSYQELSDHGLESLGNGIKRNWGFIEVRKKLGIEEERKPSGYWTDRENLNQELEKIIQQLDHFPSEDELKNLKKTTMPDSIRRVYGSFPKARKYFGFETVRKERFSQSLDDAMHELKEIIQRIGHFPTYRELKDIDGGLVSAIGNRHGGLSKVREEMGYEGKERPKKYWKEWDNVEIELLRIINQIGHFPSTVELRKMNKNIISVVIGRYHGGFREARKKMGSGDGIKPNGYWMEWENIANELKAVINKLGHFPTSGELNTYKKFSLTVAIQKYHGGINAVRSRLQEEGILPSEQDQLEKLVEQYVEE
jgi:transposase-like protein